MSNAMIKIKKQKIVTDVAKIGTNYELVIISLKVNKAHKTLHISSVFVGNCM